MKTKRKLLLILLVYLGAFAQLQAQKTIASAGGNLSGTGGTVSYTIGQIDFTAATGTNGMSNQGVQHPHEIYIVGLDPNPSDDIQLSVYPNPATSFVKLTVKNIVFSDVSYQLFDENGLLLDSDIVKGSPIQIPIEKFASSTLVLRVLKGNAVLRSFKIIKN